MAARFKFRYSQGFTLIELLSVVAIIGILAVIAIPQFEGYRQRAFDSRSLTDLRNAAAAEEAYFADYERYVDCAGASECQEMLPGFRFSEGVDIAMSRVAEAGSPEYFSGRAFHPRGAHRDEGTAFMWNSLMGGLQ